LPVQGSEQWKTAFGVSLLAKQAGYDVKFAWSKELPIPESDVYLLPSVQTTWGIPAHVYRELQKRVENGAKLLVTSCGGMLQPFADIFGCRVDYSHQTPEVREITMDGETFHCASEWTSRLLAEKCTVLATLADGSPVFTRCAYGKGEVFFLNAPIEEEMVERRAVMAPFYRKFFTLAGVKRRVTEKDDFIGVTEHPMDNKLVIVLINYSSKAGSAVIDGNTWYYLRLDGAAYYVISAASDPAAVILNVGDYVTVKFAEGEGSILSAYSVTKTDAPVAENAA
jgi:hypothetical protein